MSYTHLTLEERYVIYHLVLYGLTLREIGRRLNRHHMTISREIKRNRPTYADAGQSMVPPVVSIFAGAALRFRVSGVRFSRHAGLKGGFAIEQAATYLDCDLKSLEEIRNSYITFISRCSKTIRCAGRYPAEF
jgi:hypothetical protein